jgi:hypothetical protein
MKEFYIRDCNNYIIGFAEPVKKHNRSRKS